jgi:hypothetical protein
MTVREKGIWTDRHKDRLTESQQVTKNYTTEATKQCL